MKISVCMATFNGEKYIKEQIFSILDQLKIDDELIVVDDCSSDCTVNIIKCFNSSKIKIYLNDRNYGHVFSFSRAISLAKNEIIFLSDQDDIWVKGRVKLMSKKLQDNRFLLVSTNFDIITMDSKNESFSINLLKERDSTKHLNNIISIFLGKRSYYGCAMAFQKKLINVILPIPSFVESHDIWIALAGNLLRSNVHLQEKTLIRRLHNNNATKTNRRFLPKLWSRVTYFLSIFLLIYRISKNSFKEYSCNSD